MINLFSIPRVHIQTPYIPSIYNSTMQIGSLSSVECIMHMCDGIFFGCLVSGTREYSFSIQLVCGAWERKGESVRKVSRPLTDSIWNEIVPNVQLCVWWYLIHCALTGTLKIMAHEPTSWRFFMGLWKTGDSY